MLTIAHRKAIDAHRARKRRPAPVETVARAANRSRRRARDTSLWQAVRELPGKQRAAVVHRFVNDLAYVEIGQMIRLVGGGGAAQRLTKD